MNILRNFFILLPIMATLTGCDKENHIDYSSFNIKPEIILFQKHQGFIITDTISPFNIPLEFKQLKNASKSLINSNWLANPSYLEDINHLIYDFNQTHIKESNLFIQALNNSALIYKHNMIEVNNLKRNLQKDINHKLDYYQQEITSINTTLAIIEMPEIQHLKNIALIKTNIQKKQQYYVQLRRLLRNSLHSITLSNDLIADLISDINFKYKRKNTLYCSQYLGDYQQVTLSLPHACVYYNQDQLITKVPDIQQQQVKNILNQYVPQLWTTMVQLNGYFESDYNEQVFDNYLHKNLIIANNNLTTKRSLNAEWQGNYAIEKQVNKLKQLNIALSKNMNNHLLDEHKNINISTTEFYKKLSPLLTSGDVKDPISPFSQLYNNKIVIEKFSHEYATKILNTYPKELTFDITNNGTFTLPKIHANHYKIVIDVKENYSVIYNSCDISMLPKNLTRHTPNTSLIKYNLNQIISQQLFNQWANN